MLKAVELVEDKKNSTDFFYPKSCQVYILTTCNYQWEAGMLLVLWKT